MHDSALYFVVSQHMYCVAEPCEKGFTHQEGNVVEQNIIKTITFNMSNVTFTEQKECANACKGMSECKSYEFHDSTINTTCRLMNKETIDKYRPSGFFNCLKIGNLIETDLDICYLIFLQSIQVKIIIFKTV